MTKKFAVFDIDGTVFRWQLYSEIVFELINSGHLPLQAREDIDLKMSDWRRRKHARSFQDFELAIVMAFRHHIKNISVAAMEDAAEAIVKRSGEHTYIYTKELLQRLKSDGYTLIAVSGSHNEIVQKFASFWQFDIALGQIHDTKNDMYTDSIPGDRLVVFHKGEILKEIVEQHNLSWKDSIAVGDSKSDIAMLECVEQPIAFNPNEELFDHAKQLGWKVVIERKNMIYELEQHDGIYLLEKAGTR